MHARDVSSFATWCPIFARPFQAVVELTLPTCRYSSPMESVGVGYVLPGTSRSRAQCSKKSQWADFATAGGSQAVSWSWERLAVRGSLANSGEASPTDPSDTTNASSLTGSEADNSMEGRHEATTSGDGRVPGYVACGLCNV